MTQKPVHFVDKNVIVWFEVNLLDKIESKQTFTKELRVH